MWTKTGIGKHRTRTLPHVLMNDPEWFYWAYHEGVFKGHVFAEARLIYQYAKTIQVGRGKNQCYEYRMGENIGVYVVDKKSTAEHANMEVKRSNTLDLEFPRQQKGYKPEQYEYFMDCVQKIFFNKISKPYVKREACEKFFATPKHFGYKAKN